MEGGGGGVKGCPLKRTFYSRSFYQQADRGEGGGAKGLSELTTKKRTFFVASLTPLIIPEIKH